MTRNDVLVVEQIAEILGNSPNTIQRKEWRVRTGCPLHKKGRRLYALVDEFKKWMGK